MIFDPPEYFRGIFLNSVVYVLNSYQNEIKVFILWELYVIIQHVVESETGYGRNCGI